MRHAVKNKSLGMSRAHRVAVLRNMAALLIEKGRIHTTADRAKALKVFVEPLITKGKADTLSARRLVIRRLPNKDAVKRLFDHVSPTFINRAGGYTRILRTGQRKGDNASLAFIEFVDPINENPKQRG
ncbi:MAG: 50S ribosomal protein L17 [Deferribacteraceae bacterium]|nr:50S ribosomal protein L17 [Deferribacteraceae bacterium]